MEYTVSQLSRLAEVSGRTLRHYDDIGLLTPSKRDNGYRAYTAADVDRLQQILFYRELGMGLNDIATIVNAPNFDRQSALNRHLSALKAQQERVDRLIRNVTLSITAIEGGVPPMSDKAKFEGFRRDMIDENERKYGAEVHAKYGDDIAI